MGDKKTRIMKMSWKNLKVYLLDFLIEIATFPIYIIIIYLLWKTILKNSTFAISLNEITTYYILAYAIKSITTQRKTATNMSRKIRNGNIITVLSRPITYLKYSFYNRLAVFLFFAVLYLPILAVTNIFFKLQITNSPIIIILFLISLILSAVMNFMFFFTIGVTSFWVINNQGIINSFSILKRFLSGSWIPLSLIEGAFGKAVMLLPFQYMLYFPITVIQGKLTTTEILSNFIIIIAWTIIFYLLAKISWHYGEKHLTGVGV